MPKKKSGARKKAEKQKERQKGIRTSTEARSLVQQPCNSMMVGRCVHRIMIASDVILLRSVTSVRDDRRIEHSATSVV